MVDVFTTWQDARTGNMMARERQLSGFGDPDWICVQYGHMGLKCYTWDQQDGCGNIGELVYCDSDDHSMGCPNFSVGMPLVCH